MNYREVSKDEFFATVGQMDVHPYIQPPGKFPYVALWRLRTQEVVGKSVDAKLGPSRYYVPIDD